MWKSYFEELEENRIGRTDNEGPWELCSQNMKWEPSAQLCIFSLQFPSTLNATRIGKIRFKLDYRMKTKELEVCKQGGALHTSNQGVELGSGGSAGWGMSWVEIPIAEWIGSLSDGICSRRDIRGGRLWSEKVILSAGTTTAVELWCCHSGYQWERATSVWGRKSSGVSQSGNRTPGVRQTVCIAADFTKDDTAPRYTGQGARCLISQWQSGWWPWKAGMFVLPRKSVFREQRGLCAAGGREG